VKRITGPFPRTRVAELTFMKKGGEKGRKLVKEERKSNIGKGNKERE